VTVFWDAFAGEWSKIRTVRSTIWTLLLAFLLCVGLGLLFCLSLRAAYDRLGPEQHANWDPVAVGFYSLSIGQISLVVFGVLLVSAEHSTGMIRASLVAVPNRTTFFAAKVSAGVVTAAGFALVTVAATFAVAQRALGPHGTSLGQPGVLRATVFAALYLTLMCAFAIGVAAMLRGTALSLGIMIPLLFLDSQGLGNVPKIRAVAQFLPDQAGMVMAQVVTPQASSIAHRDFGPWTALLIVIAWTTAALLGGHLALRGRDA
jgi:hypothetical protein